MKKTLIAAVACAALVIGCGSTGIDEPGSSPETNTATAAASHDDTTVVARLEDGLFQRSMVPTVTITPSGPSTSWSCDWGYWVDLRVKNLSYEKQVGLIWTDDDWKTVRTSDAHYKADLGGGYERWGLDLTGRSASGSPPTIQYAAFAKMNGDTYYGKENNSENYTLHP
jgi:hypothetical protein